MSIAVSIEKRLGAFALSVAFTSKGRITALFGRSGAGKTSVINLIAGMQRPDAGFIRVGDTTLVDTTRGIFVPTHRRRIGYVFQEGRLFPHLTVRANLLYGRWLSPRAGRWGSLDQVVALLGIGHLLDRRPAALSGGEKQRVAIGRALLASPRLLLMDEPLASVDQARKEEILPYIERLRAEMDLPIIYVSHAVEEVARLADTIVLLDAGHVVAAGPVNEVLPRVEAASSGLVEASVVLFAIVTEQDAEGGQTILTHPAGRLQVPHVAQPVGTEVRLRVRARDVALAVGDVGRLSIRNRLAATVVAITEGTPPAVEVRLDAAGAPLVARITRDAATDLGLAVGARVTALVKSVAFDG